MILYIISHTGLNQKAIILGLMTYALIFVFVGIPWLIGSDSQPPDDKQPMEQKSQNEEKQPESEIVKNKANVCVDRLIVLNSTSRNVGDAMFQYAALIGVAKVNHFKPYLYDRGCVAFRDVFIKTHNLLCNDQISYTDKFVVRKERGETDYDPDVSRLHQDAPSDCIPVKLTGARQSWRYFTSVKQQLREVFTFHDPHRTFARAFIEDLALPRGTVTVGLVLEVGRGSKNEIPDPDLVKFIKNAMTYFENEFASVVFIAYSDYQWTGLTLVKTGRRAVHTLANVKASTAIAVMASCKHVIFTSGSIGWWSAYLADGITVYYKGSTFDQTARGRQLNKVDYYYPGWVGLH